MAKIIVHLALGTRGVLDAPDAVDVPDARNHCCTCRRSPCAERRVDPANRLP